jgi:O-antigen/teichoic acid export membrane protein
VIFIAALRSSVPGVSLGFKRFDQQIAKTLFHSSKWAFLNNLGTYIFDLFAWAILGSFASMDQAALFGLANKPLKQLWNLVDKGANVALPQLSRFHSEKDTVRLQQTYLRTLKIVFGAVVPFVVLGSIFARPLILVWAGSKYAEAAIVMQWLLLAAFSHAVAYPSDQLIYACGEVRYAAKITFWSGSISVVGGLLLVSRYGAAGLAAGMALAQLSVNCTWFTVAACRLSRTSFTALIGALFDGLGWPLALLALEIAAIAGLARYLSGLQTLVAAVVGGLLYLSLWTLRTALPLYRGQTEIVA